MKTNWNMGHWEGGRYISSGKRGYWSKYGGGKQYKEPEEITWYCQSCQEIQPAVMHSYSIPFGGEVEENTRVCAICKHIAIRRKTVIYIELRKLVSPFQNLTSALANLLSLPTQY